MGYAPHRAFGIAAAGAAAMALAAGACGNKNHDAAAPEQLAADRTATDERGDQADAGASDEAEFSLALLRAAYRGGDELAVVATNRSQAARVESHAEDLREDYERLGAQIDQVAGDLDIEFDAARGIGPQVSRELASVYGEQRQALEALEGADFDRAYLTSLLVTTQATMNEIERVRRDIPEAEVRRLVEQHLDALSRQLERTRDVARREAIQLED